MWLYVLFCILIVDIGVVVVSCDLYASRRLPGFGRRSLRNQIVRCGVEGSKDPNTQNQDSIELCDCLLKYIMEYWNVRYFLTG